MIDCTQAVKQLWDYLERELDSVEHERMDEHLAYCRRCCGEVEFAEEIRDMMKLAARPNIPAEASERLGQYLEDLEGGAQ
ncbi:MAG: anti-sigma factor family protein [Acidimicrobiia bacterium]